MAFSGVRNALRSTVAVQDMCNNLQQVDAAGIEAQLRVLTDGIEATEMRKSRIGCGAMFHHEDSYLPPTAVIANLPSYFRLRSVDELISYFDTVINRCVGTVGRGRLGTVES